MYPTNKAGAAGLTLDVHLQAKNYWRTPSRELRLLYDFARLKLQPSPTRQPIRPTVESKGLRPASELLIRRSKAFASRAADPRQWRPQGVRDGVLFSGVRLASYETRESPELTNDIKCIPHQSKEFICTDCLVPGFKIKIEIHFIFGSRGGHHSWRFPDAMIDLNEIRLLIAAAPAPR
jgi:hypothetical protein